MPLSSLESALVRILIDDKKPRKPVGAGFLVTPNHVITCAHVINDALGRKQNASESPDVNVVLDFPLIKNQPLMSAKIIKWFPVRDDSVVGEIEDIAVLEILESLPDDAQPSPLVTLDNKFFTEHRVRMCGFPVGVDDGTYANGRLQGLTAKGWVEIHHDLDSVIVEQGFSGTAVWAITEKAVCGMTVSMLSRNESTTAYMIPASTLIKAFPELDKLSRPENPYRGLEAFREKDADFYFGREDTIEDLSEKVHDKPFVLVIGASGSGKSSVVLAGVTPALRKTGNWLIAACRPKKQTFYELSSCLIPLLYQDKIKRLEEKQKCADNLFSETIKLSNLIQELMQEHDKKRFLLIIDQFEELYTLNPDKDIQHRFLDMLIESLTTPSFTVLLTMRSDFIATALMYAPFNEAFNKYSPTISIMPINEQGLKDAIEQPAAKLNFKLEPGLTELILKDLGNEPGSLPLLEFCMTQLWERQTYRQLTIDAYKAIGGVNLAIATHADSVYEKFEEQEKKNLRHIFLQLVRPGHGTEDTRQVATIEQVKLENRELITKLANERLIVTGRDEESKTVTIEVVHEALIRSWQTLRQWVDEDRKFLTWQEELRVFLRKWKDNNHDESGLLRGLTLGEAQKWLKTHDYYIAHEERKFIQQSAKLKEREEKAKKEAQEIKEKQRKRNIIALSAGLLIAVVLSVISFAMWQKAEDQRKIADNQHELADKKTQEAEKEKNNAERQATIAEMNSTEALSHLSYSLLSSNNSREDAKAVITGIKAGKKAYQKKAVSEFNYIVTLVTANLNTVINNSMLELKTLAGHSDYVYSVSFSPAGKTLASASKDKTVKLWDIETGNEIKTLSGHSDSLLILFGASVSVRSVSFSPDGKTLASGSEDKTVKLWNFDLDLLIKHGCERIEWYLKHSHEVSDEDRTLCDDVL